jgi:hydrogenase maturation protein HypF
MGLTGWVRNDSHGATLEAQGVPAQLDAFARRLRDEMPLLGRLETCEESPADVLAAEDRFDIVPSEHGELADAQVTVDVAVCPECLREMADPTDRRYRYPFINCTQCGPRYSIVRGIPYDRPNTTMADFAMCPACAEEYGDPASRRFHAQPIACAVCGPSVWLVDSSGRQMVCDDPVHEAAAMLREGFVLAVKGLGGFHLACRADQQDVVLRLRKRKRRDAKPFALMVADLDQARALCEVGPQAEALLEGPLKPAVLMPIRRSPSGAEPGKRPPVCPAVAEGLSTLGLMLPYTPLHHLLLLTLKDLGRGAEDSPDCLWPPPLVMTSGNYSDEPLESENDSAIAALGAIADAILLHNRKIERRVDDSVVQIHADGEASVVRRARGYAPRPVRLAGLVSGHPVVLAVGAELKNTVCLVSGERALVSEHIGDLKDGRVYRHFMHTIHHLEKLYDVTPQVVAADMHPQYLSTEYALRRWRGQIAGRSAVPIIRVQHHHAHLASLLAEHGRSGPIIGLVCDGTGYGDDGASWGCEVLYGDLKSYQRVGHLRYLPQPGGDAAAKETMRPAVAAVFDALPSSCEDYLLACRPEMPKQRIEPILSMLQMEVNCPPSSSLGRWFDAVAWLCGLAEHNRFEADAAMTLESVAAPGVTDVYGFAIVAEGPFIIDWRMMVEGLVHDLLGGAGAAHVAAKFHNTVARFLLAAAQRAREITGETAVGLTGGCFANRYLTALLTKWLREEGFEVLRHHEVPCNDGGLALGQAVVAAARTGVFHRRSAAVSK